jgi:phenylalanyl-tRNA synthetase beta subunit
LEFQSQDHTLKDQEIDPIVARIVDAARTSCGAVLRS